MKKILIIQIIFISLFLTKAFAGPNTPEAPAGGQVLAFVHKASDVSAANPNVTILDHHLLNGNPDAIIVVTKIWSRYENGTTLYVYYDPDTARWRIFSTGNIWRDEEFNVMASIHHSMGSARSSGSGGTNSDL